MATIANLVLLNNAAANVNFLPDTVRTGEYAKWADRTQGTFVGAAYASFTRKINPQPTGVRKIQAKLVVPTVDGVTGLLKYQGIGTAELSMPNGMTLLEKQELYARFKSMVASAVFGTAVTTDEMPWG